mmetsp:Transcript_9600/g.28150  ORF Transcript_9600/g.28150 Transcript_9600/m.28150 type:complete len:209 (-) Transcript_9600:53-679(-)
MAPRASRLSASSRASCHWPKVCEPPLPPASAPLPAPLPACVASCRLAGELASRGGHESDGGRGAEPDAQAGGGREHDHESDERRQHRRRERARLRRRLGARPDAQLVQRRPPARGQADVPHALLPDRLGAGGAVGDEESGGLGAKVLDVTEVPEAGGEPEHAAARAAAAVDVPPADLHPVQPVVRPEPAPCDRPSDGPPVPLPARLPL